MESSRTIDVTPYITGWDAPFRTWSHRCHLCGEGLVPRRVTLALDGESSKVLLGGERIVGGAAQGHIVCDVLAPFGKGFKW